MTLTFVRDDPQDELFASSLPLGWLFLEDAPSSEVTGQISLSGSAALQADCTASGALDLSGSASLGPPNVAAGSITLGPPGFAWKPLALADLPFVITSAAGGSAAVEAFTNGPGGTAPGDTHMLRLTASATYSSARADLSLIAAGHSSATKIRFWHGVSSRQYYDYGYVYTTSPDAYQTGMSGQVQWVQREVTLTASKTVSWRYLTNYYAGLYNNSYYICGLEVYTSTESSARASANVTAAGSLELGGAGTASWVVGSLSLSGTAAAAGNLPGPFRPGYPASVNGALSLGGSATAGADIEWPPHWPTHSSILGSLSLAGTVTAEHTIGSITLDGLVGVPGGGVVAGIHGSIELGGDDSRRTTTSFAVQVGMVVEAGVVRSAAVEIGLDVSMDAWVQQPVTLQAATWVTMVMGSATAAGPRVTGRTIRGPGLPSDYGETTPIRRKNTI